MNGKQNQPYIQTTASSGCRWGGGGGGGGGEEGRERERERERIQIFQVLKDMACCFYETLQNAMLPTNNVHQALHTLCQYTYEGRF